MPRSRIHTPKINTQNTVSSLLSLFAIFALIAPAGGFLFVLKDIFERGLV